MDNSFMASVCFLTDIFKHMNDLNLGLQGRGRTVTEPVEQMHVFQVKLNLFETDLSTGIFQHSANAPHHQHKSRM